MSETEQASGAGLSLEEVARVVEGRVEGGPGPTVRAVAPLEEAGPGELGFLASRRYLSFLEETEAGALLVAEALAGEVGGGRPAVVVSDPHRALSRLLPVLHPAEEHTPGVHPTAVVEADVELGEDVSVGALAVLGQGARLGSGVRVGAQVFVGAGVEIGNGAVLHPQVVLYPGTRIGRRVIVHAGARIGVDGFGYATVDGEHRKVPQVGGCVIEDDVEIGANVCIDRGSIGESRVGRGTKIDNLVHLAHNVRLGPGCILTAQVGIAGSTRVGKGVVFGGQAGATGHVEIGDGARLGARAGVIGDVAPGETVSGFPARPHRDFLRGMSLVMKLPETWPETNRRLRELESEVERLRSEREGPRSKGDER